MKKGIVCLVLCLVVAFGFVACSGGGGSSSSSAGGNTNTGNGSGSSNNGSSTDTTAPSVPTNLLATAVTSSSISLSWTASTDDVGVTGYNILRNGAKISTSATSLFSDSGLSSSTTYTYAVSAYDAAGNTTGLSLAVAASTSAVLVSLDISAIPSPVTGIRAIPTHQFTATAQYADGTSHDITATCSWSLVPVSSATGTISASGLFTASPQTVSCPPCLPPYTFCNDPCDFYLGLVLIEWVKMSLKSHKTRSTYG